METKNPTTPVRSATVVVRFPMQERFDPTRDYMVARRFRLSDVEQVPNQPFDKDRTTTRRLKQLYEQRLIKMVPVEQTKPAEPSEPQQPPAFTELSNEALRGWLRDVAKITPRPGLGRARLIELCNTEYQKQQAGQQVA